MTKDKTPYQKLNLPPETLIYTGQYTKEPLRIDVYLYDENQIEVYHFNEPSHVAKLKKAVEDSRSAWVNVEGICDVKAVESIGAAIGLPKLYLEDIVNVNQRTKLENTPGGLFTVTKMLRLNRAKWQESGHIEMMKEHLSMALWKNTVITFQEKEGDAFEGVRTRLQVKGGRMRSSGADYLFYALFDALIDHQLEILHSVNDALDQIEKRVIDGGKMNMSQLYRIRRELLSIKSASFPLKDVIMTLVDEDMEWIKPATKIYFRDVSDHIAHVTDQTILYREIVNNLYEMHMLDTSNNMSRVMTTLTIFSAIFIPLNFLAGFFGMNFTDFDWLRTPNAIPIFIAICMTIGASMVLYFKSKEWF